MSFVTLRRWIVLALLVTFVAYFGVWQLYLMMSTMLGQVWAIVLGVLSAFGLGVIAMAGIIIVRTREILSAADAKSEGEEEEPGDMQSS